jgi:hypothetical protein
MSENCPTKIDTTLPSELPGRLKELISPLEDLPRSLIGMNKRVKQGSKKMKKAENLFGTIENFCKEETDRALDAAKCLHVILEKNFKMEAQKQEENGKWKRERDEE